MKPIKTRHTNRILGAPDGWNVLKNSPCIGLPVAQTKTGPGDSELQYQSIWETSWRERLLILLGSPITLGINSSFHPPVSLYVTFGLEEPPEPWNPEHEQEVEDKKKAIKVVT
jgi:hypothetical protein